MTVDSLLVVERSGGYRRFDLGFGAWSQVMLLLVDYNDHQARRIREIHGWLTLPILRLAMEGGIPRWVRDGERQGRMERAQRAKVSPRDTICFASLPAAFCDDGRRLLSSRH